MNQFTQKGVNLLTFREMFVLAIFSKFPENVFDNFLKISADEDLPKNQQTHSLIGKLMHKETSFGLVDLGKGLT